MVWIRLILLSAPLWVVGGAAWFIRQGSELEPAENRRDPDSLVVAIRSAERPDVFNPLVPSAGVTREITEMIFDRPFRRDDDLILRPHLVKGWEFHRKATFFFAGDEAAEKAADRIEKARERWSEWRLIDALRDGREIHVTLDDQSPGLPGKLAETFEADWLAQMLHVRLSVRDAVQQSFENFLASSIEKEKIRHFVYDGDRVADIYVTGETDLFLKELRLYYESNRNLEPAIEVMGKESMASSLDLILTLRDDVTWHDGQPFSADDLVFTWEELARPGSAYPFKKAFTAVDAVDKVSATVVRVKLRDYFAPILESWERLPMLPVHRLRNVHTPEEWRQFFENPIGTGPYALESKRPDGGVVLRANPDYYLGAPGQERIVYSVEDDPEERLLGVRLGRIDALFPDRREEQWISRDRRVSLVQDVPRFEHFVAWNLDLPQFADSRVRRGLARAIDLDAILAAAEDPRLRRCRSLFFPEIWFCEENLEPIVFDAEAAAKLFTVAGWEKVDGRWHDGAGEPAGFRLTYDKSNPLHQRLAPALAAAWTTAGITVDVEAADWTEMIANQLAQREFEGLLLGWELGFGRDQYDIWHSSEAIIGGTNLTGLKNQPVDSILEKLRIEDESDAVADLATGLQKHIRELQPCLFVCEGPGAPIAIRTDAVKLSRPRREGTWSLDPVTVGRAGWYASRPWWVRQPAAPMESGNE